MVLTGELDDGGGYDDDGADVEDHDGIGQQQDSYSVVLAGK